MKQVHQKTESNRSNTLVYLLKWSSFCFVAFNMQCLACSEGPIRHVQMPPAFLKSAVSSTGYNLQLTQFAAVSNAVRLPCLLTIPAMTGHCCNSLKHCSYCKPQLSTVEPDVSCTIAFFPSGSSCGADRFHVPFRNSIDWKTLFMFHGLK